MTPKFQAKQQWPRAGESTRSGRAKVIGLVVVVGVLGLGSLGAWWMRSVRQRSADSQSLSALAQLSAGAGQVFLENPRRLFVEYDEVVGVTGSVKSVPTPRGENYRGLFPVRYDELDWGYWELELPGGRKISRVPKPPVPDGVQVVKLPDGSRLETTYQGGVAEGPFRAFYPDGQIWCRASYAKGRVAGPRWLRLPDGTEFDESQASKCWEHLARARKNYAIRDLAAALADATQGIALNPSAADLFAMRGDVQVLRGELEAARADYDRSLTLLPYHLVYYQRGKVRRLLGDRPGASEDLRRGYGSERYAPAIFRFFLNEWAQGRREPAAQALREAMAQMVRDPENLLLGRFLLGEVGEEALLAGTGGNGRGRPTAAHYFAASRRALEGNEAGAAARFQEYLQQPVPAAVENGRSFEQGDGQWLERLEAQRFLEARGIPVPSTSAKKPR